MIKKLHIIIGLLFLFQQTQAQLGGHNTYEFLNMATSARISALGGNLITVRDDDVNLAYANPAALNEAMHQQIGFSHNFHLAGIQNGYASYGQHFNKLKTTFHFGVQNVNYGDFNITDVLGQVEGSFKASEYAITLGAGRQIYDRLAVGANLKYITSQFEAYNSAGLVADLSLMYFDTASNFTATVLVRNVGGQISTYEESNREPIPFEMQLGISKKLKYLPFRVSIIYHHFDRWNILYDDPN